MRVRRYGSVGPLVVVLHGGPGAPGYMAPVARGLADTHRVLEPLQRGSDPGPEPLTVAHHVDDLRELLASDPAADRPVLVGHSWGAMLALAYAAAHPERIAALVLVGCGTFDAASRARMQAVCEERTGDDLRRRLERLHEEIADPDERMRVAGDLILPVYSHRLRHDRLEVVGCDARAHRETWEDMLRLQREGLYPSAFTEIDVPVLMLHGAVDPHPGRMIRAVLARRIPQLEYYEWTNCGHYPWLEEETHEEFFAALRGWLERVRES